MCDVSPKSERVVKSCASHLANVEAGRPLWSSCRLSAVEVTVHLVDILARQTVRVAAFAAHLTEGEALFGGRIDHTGSIKVSGWPSYLKTAYKEILHGAHLVGEQLTLVELLRVVSEPVA